MYAGPENMTRWRLRLTIGLGLALHADAREPACKGEARRPVQTADGAELCMVPLARLALTFPPNPH
jgi:hypothetical protein